MEPASGVLHFKCCLNIAEYSLAAPWSHPSCWEQQSRRPVSDPPLKPSCHPVACIQSSHISLQLKYKKDLNRMKGTSHFHNLTTEDNLTLKNAKKINKIVSEVKIEYFFGFIDHNYHINYLK